MGRLLVHATLVLLVCGSATARESKYCMKVLSHFLPCMDYVGGMTPKAPKRCCTGLKKINQMANREKEAPKRICHCIKDIGHDLKFRYKAARIKSLPKKCRVHNSPISMSMDCSRI